MMVRAILATGGLLGLMSAACSLSYTEVHDHDRPRHVRVAHVHDEHCGHVWDGGAWITVSARHVHGPNCGHYYHDGRWAIVRHRGPVHVHTSGPTHVVRPSHVVHDSPRVHVTGHVHGRDCGCVYDGKVYVTVSKGHRHGPGCGHDFDGRVWVIKKSKARRLP